MGMLEAHSEHWITANLPILFYGVRLLYSRKLQYIVCSMLRPMLELVQRDGSYLRIS